METWLIKAGLPCVNAEENGNSFQYSCLENPMDRGGWQATVHGVARVGHDLANKPSLPRQHSVSAAYLSHFYICTCVFSEFRYNILKNPLLLFILLMLFMGFSRQEYWSGLPFPSPVDHILSEFSTMTHTSWVALHGMAHSFTELDKAVVHVISLISFLWLWFSFWMPSNG